jgi:hypothetical protein
MRFGISSAARALQHFMPLGPLAKLKLHDPWQIRALIGREQARAARRRRELSVVLFRASGNRARAALVRLLLRRARDTDAIGIVDGRRLCAVLADTNEAGARRYAEQICKLAAKQGIPIEEMVHTTPLPAGTGRDAEEAAANDLDWLDEETDFQGMVEAAYITQSSARRLLRELMVWLSGPAEAPRVRQPARPPSRATMPAHTNAPAHANGAAHTNGSAHKNGAAVAARANGAAPTTAEAAAHDDDLVERLASASS